MSERKQYFTILAIVFLGFLGISIPYLIFPSLFLNPAYSILPPTLNPPLFLGITLAAYPFGQFLGSPILGSLSDDYGRKPLLQSTLSISVLMSLLSGLAIHWKMIELLILSRFGAGLMEGNIAIARALAADLKTISKTETFGKINAVSSISYLIGPLIGGILADEKVFKGANPATPFYLIAFLFLVVSILSSILKNTKPTEKEKNSFLSRLNLFKRTASLFKNRELKFYLIMSTIFTLAIDIFYEFSPVYLTVEWMLGPSQLILYNSLASIALAIGSGWLANAFSKKKRMAMIGSSSCLAIFLILMITVNDSFSTLLLFALAGIAIGLGTTLITVQISDSASPTIQGEVLGVQISLRVLGDSFICLLGGVLLLLSSKFILLIAALLSAGAALFFANKKFITYPPKTH